MKKRTKQEVKKILKDFQNSGLSKSQFYKSRKIPRASFYKLLKKDDLQENVISFIPVCVKNYKRKNTSSKTQVSEKIVLKTISGVSIELPLSISVEWVLPLLKGLV